MMDDYFNVPEYTDQFAQNNGGFFSDSDGKHPGRREPRNPKGWIYWSAKTGYHENSIVNSYMEKEIYGVKYLFVTVDYNPTQDVLDWLNEFLPQYPDHRVIITTHAYCDGSGGLITSEEGNTVWPMGITGQVMWDECFSRHENIMMIVSGHVGVTQLVTSFNYGDNGNRVLQVLVDPQSYDVKEVDENKDGVIETSGTQDTGLVLYMNFSEDGNTVSFDYYSTLLDKFLKGNSYTFNMGDSTDNIKQEGTFDMAGLTQFGQETPLVTQMSRPTLDGRISSGEYAYTKVSAADAIGQGKINGELKEYYAYDDQYLYYAFEAPVTATAE